MLPFGATTGGLGVSIVLSVEGRVQRVRCQIGGPASCVATPAYELFRELPWT